MDVNILTGIIVGVIGSLVAAVMLAIVAACTRHGKGWLIRLVMHLTGSPIDRVYSDGEASLRDTSSALSQAKFVYILTGRGDELAENPGRKFAVLFNASKKYDFVRVLLPDWQVPSDAYDWLAARGLDLEKGGEVNAQRDLKAAVPTNIDRIRGRSNQQMELRKFNVPNIGRIIVTDRVALFGPYEPDLQGGLTSVYRVPRGSTLYSNLKGFVEQVWESAVELPRSKSKDGESGQ